jgi:hypothetical protein
LERVHVRFVEGQHGVREGLEELKAFSLIPIINEYARDSLI